MGDLRRRSGQGSHQAGNRRRRGTTADLPGGLVRRRTSMCEFTRHRGPPNARRRHRRATAGFATRWVWPAPCTRAASEDIPVMTDRRSVLMGVVLGALLAGCGRAAGPPPPSPSVVKVEPVAEHDVAVSGEWVGTLVGYINAQIRPRVS